MFSMDQFTCLCSVSNSVVSPQQKVVVVTLLESVEGHIFSIESHINNADKYEVWTVDSEAEANVSKF